jgi:hypothetical protein
MSIGEKIEKIHSTLLELKKDKNIPSRLYENLHGMINHHIEQIKKLHFLSKEALNPESEIGEQMNKDVAGSILQTSIVRMEEMLKRAGVQEFLDGKIDPRRFEQRALTKFTGPMFVNVIPKRFESLAAKMPQEYVIEALEGDLVKTKPRLERIPKVETGIKKPTKIKISEAELKLVESFKNMLDSFYVGDRVEQRGSGRVATNIMRSVRGWECESEQQKKEILDFLEQFHLNTKKVLNLAEDSVKEGKKIGILFNALDHLSRIVKEKEKAGQPIEETYTRLKTMDRIIGNLAQNLKFLDKKGVLADIDSERFFAGDEEFNSLIAEINQFTANLMSVVITPSDEHYGNLMRAAEEFKRNLSQAKQSFEESKKDLVKGAKTNQDVINEARKLSEDSRLRELLGDERVGKRIESILNEHKELMLFARTGAVESTLEKLATLKAEAKINEDFQKSLESLRKVLGCEEGPSEHFYVKIDENDSNARPILEDFKEKGLNLPNRFGEKKKPE